METKLLHLFGKIRKKEKGEGKNQDHVKDQDQGQG